jgi:indolepyruvate ferredoxin oxidoreductase beta subunit
MTAANSRPLISVLVCALGGEGGGVLARWLVDTAVAAGHAAQSTSIPGVAQRTGATTYYVEIAACRAVPGEVRPLFSLYPVPGALDLLASSELLETARQVGAGFATRERTCVLSSTHRTLTTAEKMQLGDGRAPSTRLLEVIRAYSRRTHVLDMAALAHKADTAISAVMLGAIAASDVLPFTREHYEATIRRGATGVESSLRGFALGLDEVRGLHTQAASPGAPIAVPPLAMEVAARFPAAAHDLIALALQRLREYQDEAYGQLYLQRLQRIGDAESVVDLEGANGSLATREAARSLALWMAFDDVVRVADLKSRRDRFARVRREVGAGQGDLLRLYDYMKPGIAEIAGLLPSSVASHLVRWERRRVAAGRAPIGFALALGSHRVHNRLLLRVLGRMKGLRRRGSRFAQEQVMIEHWLDRTERGLRGCWSLGHELALCGRLVKGYGSTNARGKEALMHILDHLVDSDRFPDPEQRARAVRQAREAALSDDAGSSFDRTLSQFGAPARPLKPQPIKWAPRAARPGGTADSNRASAK